MTHYAGLDVSVRTTSICIVDEAGKVVREIRIPTEPWVDETEFRWSAAPDPV